MDKCFYYLSNFSDPALMLYTYFDYLEKTEQIRDEFDQTHINSIINNINALQPYSFLGLPVVYLLDYRTKAYIFCSQNVKKLTGYHCNEFTEGGLAFTLSVVNKWDMKVYAEKVFEQNMQFLGSVPHNQHNEFVFSSSFRWKTKKGENLYIKQSNIFLQSAADNLPMYTMGTILNLSSIKNDPLITHQIEKDDSAVPHPQNRVLVTNYFYPEDAKPVLSKREVEVIKLAASGFSSKQIAGKMHISIHTVNRHRSNILIKTNCKNIAELVSYALTEKIL